MTSNPRELLIEGLKELHIPGADACVEKLLGFGLLVLEANQQTNLTGAKDLEGLISDHILDSLAPLELVSLSSPIVDVGSGAGFPGIPAAIVHGHHEFVLVEPRAKRAAFLEAAVRHLDLKNAAVIKSSALGPGAAGLAGRAGTVLMRAVAEPERALALGLALLRPGGWLLLYEGRLSEPTGEQRLAANRAGGGNIKTTRLTVPGLDAMRHAWLIKKRKHAGVKS